MSDTKKLGKQLEKSKEAVEARKTELDSAVFAYANAVAAHAVVLEQLEQAEALEAVRDLRGKGK